MNNFIKIMEPNQLKFNKDAFLYYFVDGLLSIKNKGVYNEDVILGFAASYCKQASKLNNAPDYTELIILAQTTIENFEICHQLNVIYKPAVLQ